jgi:hypothetical protein
VRRFISISLLLLFTLPLVSPLFAASTADANVRACCRRNGKHHCAMGAAAQSAGNNAATAKAASIHERCPCETASSAAVNLPFVPNKTEASVHAGILSQPARHAQTESLFHISSGRSHQKRGPPSLFLSRS